MSGFDIAVLIGGAALIVAIAWFFWGPKHQGTRAALTSSGYQEATILVKGGYTPDAVVVQRGKPVRLTFRREESGSCSEMVVFGDFGKSAMLPEGALVPVELMPAEAGEFAFGCQMGMLRGRLIVE